MLSREDNQLLTRIGPGTPMGELMRQYWQPILISSELAAPDGPPVLFEHIPCGSPVQSQVRCAACGQVHNTDVATRPGPGATTEF